MQGNKKIPKKCCTMSDRNLTPGRSGEENVRVLFPTHAGTRNRRTLGRPATVEKN